MKKYYLVATCQGDSPLTLDQNINIVLTDKHILPINISIAVHKEDGFIKYTATLLYEHVE